MGMSTSVTLYKTDDKYSDMLILYRQCEKLGIDIPEEVLDYFNHEDPNNFIGIPINYKVEKNKVIDRESCDTWLIDLNDIPKDVRFIVFSNSY